MSFSPVSQITPSGSECKLISAEAGKDAVAVLIDVPGSIRLTAKQTDAAVVRRCRSTPKSSSFIAGVRKAEASGASIGKKETVVDRKFVACVIPAEYVLRAIDRGKDAPRNKFDVVGTFGETFFLRNEPRTFESRMPVGATSTRSTLPLPPLTQRLPSASSVKPLAS